MRLLLSRVCGPVTVAASILSLAVSRAAQRRRLRRVARRSLRQRRRSLRQTPPPAQTSLRRIRPRSRRRPTRRPKTRAVCSRPAGTCSSSGAASSSVSGDPARWQRYQDLRDGLLFTEARVLHETPDWNGTLGADNVGWRDQRFFGSYERVGLLKINGLWDEIPQFYSVDTRTAFTEAEDGVLLLDDNAQRAASHNAYLSISPQFDLRERRDVGTFRVSATPTVNFDVTGGFTTTKHSGELPWGASFGFSNDNEVALPYRSRTNDMDVGLQWTNRSGRCFAPPTTVRGSTTRPTR